MQPKRPLGSPMARALLRATVWGLPSLPGILVLVAVVAPASTRRAMPASHALLALVQAVSTESLMMALPELEVVP